MLNIDSLTTMSAPETKQAVIEFFDPPMCCPSGLCGPVLDQLLLDVNEMILSLEAEGFPVTRYQMTSSPQAFLGNPEVMRLVREQQMAALPITVVHGKVIKVGDYPTITDIKENLNGAK
jgi:hypothetical protein